MTERYVIAHGLAGEAVARVVLHLPLDRVEIRRDGGRVVAPELPEPTYPLTWAATEAILGEMVAKCVYETAQKQCLSTEEYAQVDGDAIDATIWLSADLTTWIDDERYTDSGGEEHEAWHEVARTRAISLAYGYTPEITNVTRHLLSSKSLSRSEIERIVAGVACSSVRGEKSPRST